jgi:DNA-binding CsgD family transcriptional regulator
MEKQLMLLQQLYIENAAIHDVAIVITDTLGNLITRPVGDPEKLSFMIDAGQSEKVATSLIALLSEPLSLQSREYIIKPTIKVTIHPIHINSHLEYYIWFIYSSEFEMADKLDKLKTTLAITEALLSLESEKGWIRKQVSTVRELAVIVDQPTSSKKIHEMMDLLFQSHKDIDFLGYAEKENGIGFQVIDWIHNNEATLLGVHFLLGEGFLGQVATTRQLGYWEHIERDPRIGFFIQNDVHPQTLFCYPIMNNHTLVGLLFGGSEKETDIADGLLHLGQSVAALMGIQQTFQSLRSDRDTYYLRMSILMEICKTLSVVNDIKRVLFILVDLSLNLVQGTFSCVILKQEVDKMNIVSRGMPHSQAENYMKDISVRYGETATKSLDEHAFDGAGLYTFDGIPIMEFPLMYGDTFYGVLAIAITSNDDFIEYKEFMQSLTIVASSAIDRIQGELSTSIWETIELLHRSLQQWNPQAFKISQLAREMIAEYYQISTPPTMHNIMVEMVILVYVFDPNKLKNILKATAENASFISLAQEVQQIRLQSNGNFNKSETAYSDNSQLAALALFYAENSTNPQYEPPISICSELRESFAGFFAKRQVVDMEMTLFEPAAAAETRTDHADLKQSIRELTLLSAREQEVLTHVAEGRSNRDIAEKLVISEHTVKNHMTSIFNKMGVSDRSHLIAMVYQLGFSTQ